MESLALINTQLDYLWNQMNTEILQARKAILVAKTQMNRDEVAFIGTDIIGNILRLAGRVRFFINILSFRLCNLKLNMAVTKDL